MTSQPHVNMANTRLTRQTQICFATTSGQVQQLQLTNLYIHHRHFFPPHKPAVGATSTLKSLLLII